MPSNFSWSYKRSYKIGYVWQDLCDDDLIFPAHGCEYVLKGSEIMTEAYADKRRYSSVLCPRDDNQELSKTCRESVASSLTDVSLKECAVLGKSTEGAEVEYLADGASISNSRSHIIFEFGKLKGDLPINSLRSPGKAQDIPSSDGRLYSATGTFSDGNVQNVRKHLATKSCPHVSMVENGTDAATQTEEENTQILRSGSKRGPVKVGKDGTIPQIPLDLKKIDMSSSPSSPSTTSPAAYTSESTVENPSCIDKNGGTPGPWKRATEDQDDIEAGIPNQTSIRKFSASQDPRGEEAPTRPKAKHSGASSLLQLVSCGGLDIKQQILPMSLYLKSKGSQRSTENFCDVLYTGQSRSWNRFGKSSSKLKDETATCLSSPISPISERLVNSQTGTSLGMRIKDSCVTPRSLPSEAALPDVISISRSSVSDRSTNVSRELDYQTDAHSKRKHSGEILKGSPRLRRESLDGQTESPRSKTSGEIKGSPLFMARECLGRRGPASGSLQKDVGDKSASKPGSGALSDWEVRDTVNSVKRGLAMGEKGRYVSMAQLWEELLAPKGDFKDGDKARQSLGCDVWERTLQNAVDLSLPPLEFVLLHECPHCSRKFKPELLKAHVKGCSTVKCSKVGAPGRSPKSDTNIRQRFLRTSPPATK